MDKMELLKSNNGKLQENERSLGLSHYGAPLHMATYQNYHITPNFFQDTACNGSLSDILLPSATYNELLDDLLILEEPSKYNKLLDDLLIVEEPLVQHPISKPQTYQSQHANSPIINDIDMIFNYHLSKDVLIDDSIVIPEQELNAAPIMVNLNKYTKNVLPPLPPLAPPPAPRLVRTGRPPMRKGTPSYRDNHIHSERQRRQDMTSLFNKLRSVLPNMQHDDVKVDRCTTVGQVIEYVQELDKKVEALGKVKGELLLQVKGSHKKVASAGIVAEGLSVEGIAAESDSAAPALISVSVCFCGPMDIFITLSCPKQRGMWPDLLALLQDTLPLHVQNAALSSTSLFCVHSIYAKIVGNKNDEVCCDKLQKILSNFVANYAHNNIMF